jgi:hypothetical protein
MAAAMLLHEMKYGSSISVKNTYVKTLVGSVEKRM